MGTLYIVGTPIGNLEDLTFRAARVLGQVALIAAEDTRVTRRLLSHLALRVPLTSYHRHNWQSRLPSILAALEAGDVALVTDAGMPGVSDPGGELVSRASQAGYRVEVVPGPSAVTAAMAASGFAGDGFLFLGFLPRRRRDRLDRLQLVKGQPLPLILFEAPHRVRATLQDLLEVLGDREMAVCRELTKLHEEVFRAPVSSALDYFQSPRGEFVLVVAPASGDLDRLGVVVPDLEAAGQQLQQLRDGGTKARDAVALVAESRGLPRNTVYQLWLETRRHPTR